MMHAVQFVSVDITKYYKVLQSSKPLVLKLFLYNFIHTVYYIASYTKSKMYVCKIFYTHTHTLPQSRNL